MSPHGFHGLSADQERDNKFTGTIDKVTIDLKEMKAANAEAEQYAVGEAHARKQLAD